MKKIFLSLILSLVAIFLLLPAKSQVFNGDKTLLSQADVDGFNFTSVTGKLTLFGPSINNVNGLSELQSVGGVFEISTTAITNVDALSSLQSASSLLIRGNSLLTNLNGFSSLTTVPHGFHFQNNSSLANFDGLLSLAGVIEGIEISFCPMTNLNGFTSISDITGFIILESNPFLTNVDGLQGLQGADVVNDIRIISNPLLQNINGLSFLTKAGGVIITGNQILPNLDGLSNINALGGIIIGQNPALSNVNGLSNVQTITLSLWIRSNSLLPNINGLSGLTTVGKELLIDVNGALTNIDGLSSLTSIGTNLIIAQNSHLLNLNGLQNLIEIGNDLKVTSNLALVDFCGLFKLFDEGTIGGIIEIKNNGANTVSITPAVVTVNADPGLCSAVIAPESITATANGCLVEITLTHSALPPNNTYPVGITNNITWNATDAAGNTASAVQTITVVDNQPPTITCPGDATVACATDVPVANISSVTASDNCSAVVTHVGDVITNQTCANRYTLTRTFKATDGAGNTAVCSQVITVNDDVPPTITGLNPSQVALWPPNHSMRDITLSYTATDNCASELNPTVTITSNEPVNGVADGDTDPDWEIIDAYHIRLRAERAANGNGRVYTITVTINDGCNAPVSATTQAHVAHNITGPHSGNPFRVGSTVNFTGEFWDKPTNKHTAKWLIDNSSVKGSVTEPTTNKNGKVTGSYKFNTPGVYKLQMNVIDQTGVTGYANTNGDLEEIVVIYDPNGGYTYGGGWFVSQPGALVSDPSAEGKASYGFTLNYFKSSTYPKGETQFEFKVGDFEFNALNFDYLVISNSMAQFKGTGKIIGGQSGIGFTMTVTDGQLDGSGIDKIRMEIYNKNNGAIIYDNQPGASDAALPVQAVGANSIVVISGTNSSLTSANSNQKAEMETSSPEGFNKINVIAYPNPSATNFTITVKSNSIKEKIIMQVVDMYGRMIETRNLNANSTIRFGEQYNSGTYFVRIIQGKEHKEVKLIKLFD